ncbi:hypothetical protein TNCT_159051 [Trichonephila clavata]|uniref:Uncharacterized protein n=1 Tax=Trichonephila clavata TaxID=2740835 RepID=A0A8X6LAD7_TRICU|nr:hypothetical protein TNCT_159051 [Trichonephila clavata]
MVTCTLNAPRSACAKFARVEKALASVALGWAVFLAEDFNDYFDETDAGDILKNRLMLLGSLHGEHEKRHGCSCLATYHIMAFFDLVALGSQVADDLHGRHINWESPDHCSELFILRKHIRVAFQTILVDVPPDEGVGVGCLRINPELGSDELGLSFSLVTPCRCLSRAAWLETLSMVIGGTCCFFWGAVTTGVPLMAEVPSCGSVTSMEDELDTVSSANLFCVGMMSSSFFAFFGSTLESPEFFLPFFLERITWKGASKGLVGRPHASTWAWRSLLCSAISNFRICVNLNFASSRTLFH